MKNSDQQNPGNQGQGQGNRNKGDVQISRQGSQRDRDYSQGLPTLFNTFFGNDFPGFSDFPAFARASRNLPAVNIRERRDDFIIDVAVPGMKKDDFDIKVDGNMLQISAERNYQRSEEDENYTRREFEQSSFARYFELPNSVNPENIGAKYTDGVLSITLPKKEEAKAKPPRQIRIS